MSRSALLHQIDQLKNPARAEATARYFKTGKGQYAEGDVFIGVSMPDLRKITKNFTDLPLNELTITLQQPIHEYRMAALLILVDKFKKHKNLRAAIYELYLQNMSYINNWDLVDTSCPAIVGAYIEHQDRSVLDDLADSTHLWTQRVSIVSTLFFIRKKQFSDTLRVAQKLLQHPHDLIHKAVGWMLREVGKRDELTLEEFLEEHRHQMPRTALRYAIEHFTETKRRYYLHR